MQRPQIDSRGRCVVCSGFEQESLPEHCPGRLLEGSERLAIWSGRLNFVQGKWIGNRSWIK